ncbi:MAG: hypothetical protein AAB363_07920, partial [Planctomycetota bacterium]
AGPNEGTHPTAAKGAAGDAPSRQPDRALLASLEPSARVCDLEKLTVCLAIPALFPDRPDSVTRECVLYLRVDAFV